MLDLLGDCGLHANFNIVDLSHYDANDDLSTNPSQEEENKAHQGADHIHGYKAKCARDPSSLSSGPITRLGARKYKKHLMR